MAIPVTADERGASGADANTLDPNGLDPNGRPMTLLPMRQLVTISAYWLGISALWGGYEIYGQQKVEQLVGVEHRGMFTGPMELIAALIAIAVQPTIGTISDYTTTRWGRRKPYILLGACFDLIFLIGIVTSQSVLVLGAFLALLQLSSNTAQGPFQGYIPDLVPERQVGRASALVGMMRIVGLIVGYGAVSTGAATGDYALPLLIVGVAELSLAVATFLLVREGPAGKDRAGRPWRSVAREAWGMDILHQPSFLRMAAVRLLFLAGPSAFVNYSLFYVRDSMGQTGADQTFWLIVANATLALSTAIASFPAAALSDRIGRKPVIVIAGVALSIGIAIIAAAPVPLVALVGIALLGGGAGAYLSVDWALMTEIIPLAASGRFMGLANIANSLSGPIATLIAGIVLDLVTRSMGLNAGPRAAALTGIAFVLAGIVVLRGVTPARDPRTARAREAAGG